MKKILSGMALIVFGTFVQAQTDFHIPLYPQSVQDICGEDPFSDNALENTGLNSEDAAKCTLEMTNFLEPYILEYREKAMKVARNNKKPKGSTQLEEFDRNIKLQGLQDWPHLLEEARKDKIKFLGQPTKAKETRQGAEEIDDWEKREAPYSIRSTYVDTLTDALYFLLPKPKYTKAIQRCFNRAGVANQMAECHLLQLKADEKAMNLNFQKVLAKSTDKAALQAEQKNWLIQRGQMCNFGNISGQSTLPTMAECQDTLTRARNAWLSSLLKPNAKK